MKILRFLTAGESHGPGLVGILEGLPAGLRLEPSSIDRDLKRRQLGYGRGGRMKIERDRAEILSGVRFGHTIGSPLGLVVRNRDHENWLGRMDVLPGGPDPNPMRVPRPGHADLPGSLKYGHTRDLRNVLERASARETTMRVALGAAARLLLREFGISVGSYVRSIGKAEAPSAQKVHPRLFTDDAEAIALLADGFPTRTVDEESSKRLMEAIDEAQKRRDTLGGVLEVVVTGLPPGLGSHVHWDRRLDGRLSRALLSIPAIKAVEVGDGWEVAGRFGTDAHDPILLRDERLIRNSNHAGGLEGGMTNGEPLVLRAAMKPLSTVPKALPSVDVLDLEPHPAHVERTDTCAVPAAGVVAEAMVALALADALLEALGGDSLDAMRLPFAKLRLANRTRLGHVFLLGPMGAGKTSSGLLLARRLGLPFIDLDAQIEARAGTTVRRIFETMGESGFRALEGQALAEVCTQAPAVVALGGGAVVGEEAWRAMRRAGVTVHLDAPPEELFERLAKTGGIESRPLLLDGAPQEALERILSEREPWYTKADLYLDNSRLTVEESAGAIVGLLRAVEGPLVAIRGGVGRGAE